MIYPKTQGKSITLDPKAIGRRIADARRWRSWTQADLAQAVGMKENTVAAWEGGFRLPPLRTLVNIAAHVQRSLDWLVGGVTKRASLRALFKEKESTPPGAGGDGQPHAAPPGI